MKHAKLNEVRCALLQNKQAKGKHTMEIKFDTKNDWYAAEKAKAANTTEANTTEAATAEATPMTRKEKQAANLAKVDTALHAFLDNWNKTKDRALAMKAAARVCNSPLVLSEIDRKAPKSIWGTISLTPASIAR